MHMDDVELRIKSYVGTLRDMKKHHKRMLYNWDASKDPGWVLRNIECIDFCLLVLGDLFTYEEATGEQFGLEWVKK